MITGLTNWRRWQLALAWLLIFSFVSSVLGDAHAHVAHADHAHSTHDVSAVHIADIGIAVEHDGQPEHDKVPGQESLDDLTQGCFVLLAPSEACDLSSSFDNSVWIAFRQDSLPWHTSRLERPPRFVS